MTSFELPDGDGYERLVDIYPISEKQVKVIIDDDLEITINPIIFKERERLKKFLFETFDHEEVSTIMSSVWNSDDLEDSISLTLLDDTSKEKIRKFKDKNEE